MNSDRLARAGHADDDGNETARRVWRVRRRHDHLDALLRRAGGEWRLRFLLNDRVLIDWSFPDADAARAEALARLGELQRAGWTLHW